jgi:hypothetical protein
MIYLLEVRKKTDLLAEGNPGIIPCGCFILNKLLPEEDT